MASAVRFEEAKSVHAVYAMQKVRQCMQAA